MGTFFSCCRRKKRDEESDPLLPKHERDHRHSRDRALTKVTQVAAALRAGKLPSQRQLDDALRGLLHSTVLNEQVEGRGDRLSESGRTLVHALRESADAVLQVGLEKNYDDTVQELVYAFTQVDSHAVRADVVVDTDQTVDVHAAAEHLPTEVELHADTVEFVQSLRTLSRLFLTSSAFRLILSDIFTSAREAVADVAAEVRQAAGRVQDTVQAIEEVVRPLDADAVREGAMKAEREVDKEADVAEEVVRKKLDDAFEHGPDRLREVVMGRIQQAIREAHRNPAYRSALQTLLSLFQKYTRRVSDAVQDLATVADDGRRIMPTFTPLVWTDDPDLAHTLSHLGTIISRFSSGHSVDAIVDSFYALVWDIMNVPAEVDREAAETVKAFFARVNSWFSHALQDLTYANSPAGASDLTALYDEAQVFLKHTLDSDSTNMPPWVRDIERLTNELNILSACFHSDKSTQRLLTSLNNLSTAASAYIATLTGRLASLPHQVSQKARELQQQARNDILTWLLPRLLRAMRVVPMPRVEYVDSSVEAAIDALLLTASSLGSSLTPDHIRIHTSNDVELDFTEPHAATADVSEDTPLLDAVGLGLGLGSGSSLDEDQVRVRSYTRMRVHVDGVRLAADDIGYYLRYKGPLGIGYEDEGLLSIELGSQDSAETTDVAHGGISLDVELETETSDSSSSSSSTLPLFSVKDVHVTVPDLHFALDRTRHPILNALIQPLAGPVARTAVGYYLRRQVWEALDGLARFGGKMRGERERLRENQLGGGGDEDLQDGVEQWWKAALNALDGNADNTDAATSSEDPSLQTETHIYPTVQGIVRTTKTPAGPSSDPDAAEESALAIGIGAQILPGKGGPYDDDDALEAEEAGLRGVARDALEEMQEAVDEVREDVRDVEERAVDVGRQGRQRMREEDRRRGWRSDAFDWSDWSDQSGP